MQYPPIKNPIHVLWVLHSRARLHSSRVTPPTFKSRTWNLDYFERCSSVRCNFFHRSRSTELTSPLSMRIQCAQRRAQSHIAHIVGYMATFSICISAAVSSHDRESERETPTLCCTSDDRHTWQTTYWCWERGKAHDFPLFPPQKTIFTEIYHAKRRTEWFTVECAMKERER